MPLLKRWELEGKSKDTASGTMALSLRKYVDMKGNIYYSICTCCCSVDVDEKFAKTLIPVLKEDMYRGINEVWIDKKGNRRVGMK